MVKASKSSVEELISDLHELNKPKIKEYNSNVMDNYLIYVKTQKVTLKKRGIIHFNEYFCDKLFVLLADLFKNHSHLIAVDGMTFEEFKDIEKSTIIKNLIRDKRGIQYIVV